jgi:hypothetical protein
MSDFPLEVIPELRIASDAGGAFCAGALAAGGFADSGAFAAAAVASGDLLSSGALAAAVAAEVEG